MTDKFCKDCIHFRGDRSLGSWFGLDKKNYYNFSMCMRPIKNSRVDPVSGKNVIVKNNNYCDLERGSTSKCGSEGKFFESKKGK